MRHIKTPAGEVHDLRFSPDGESIYFVSWEPYESSVGPSDFGDVSNTPGLSGLQGLFDLASRASTFRCHLFQHAYRIDVRSGEVTGKWSFSGSEVAIITPDLRSVYHSVSVAVAGGELDLRRLDLITGANVRVYEANYPYPSKVAFTPNGHILAIAGSFTARDDRYYVHRLDVWHRTELDPLPTEADRLAYSPDGNFLALANRTSVQVWRGKTIAEQWAEPAVVLAWSLDGQLAWGHLERFAVVRPGSGEPLRAWNGGERDPCSAIAFSSNNRQVLTGSYRGICAFHDAVAGRQTGAFDWGIGKIHSVCFAPDGLTCAACGEKGQVVVWDVDT